MQTQTQSKKRPAPGTVPISPNIAQSFAQRYGPSDSGTKDASAMSDDQFMAWGTGNQSLGSPAQVFSPTDPLMLDHQSTSLFSNPAQAPGQLVRRETNNQLTRQINHYAPLDQDIWNDVSNEVPEAIEFVEDDEELEKKAALAKKEAQSKRPPKQIPPFIQKLSSFLDANASNVGLIRWSDDGNSFIVLDEDEFAKKLIPELFKHNNYASFVRQLNMYGFHKKVGLSDNSMRASEKKAKSPSEYHNPYFKRGRPELLWLIQKPKSEGRGPKRQARGIKASSADRESGDEAQKDMPLPPSQDLSVGRDYQRGDVVQYDDHERHIASLQRDVANLQRAQQQIYSGLARLRDENNQYIRQAGTLVAQHERHENSINAILTFLATFYNRSLGGEGNTGNMFAGTIPNNQPQGNVVDVGDDEELHQSMHNQFQRHRKPLALMPAPPSPKPNLNERSPTSKSQTAPLSQQYISRLSLPSEHGQQILHGRLTPNNPSSNHSSSMFTAQESLNQASGSAATAPSNDQIMNLINNANANANRSSVEDNSPGPGFDFDTALRHYENANGNAPLTPEQRNNVLSLMATTSGTSTPVPSSYGQDDTAGDFLKHFSNQSEQLDLLQRLQQEQDSKVQSLADKLQPLSPSGAIPGLGGSAVGGNTGTQIYSNPQLSMSSEFDLNNFINDEYFPGLDGDADPTVRGLDFGSLQANGLGDGVQSGKNNMSGDSAHNDSGGSRAVSVQGAGRIVGSAATSSGAPSPAVEEVSDDDQQVTRGMNKRRKISI